MMNLIAILVSLAMMLTGVGGEGQPAEAARSLVLSNVAVTYNGETVRLDPQARLGISSDGEKAVVDFAVDLNGATLLPIQLGVGEGGITALFGQSDVALNLSAQALEGVSAQLQQRIEESAADMEASVPGLLQFLTEEYLPAYFGALKAASDPEFQEQALAAFRAVFEGRANRGEGTPAQLELDGENYDVTAYQYTLETEEVAGLYDELYLSMPAMADYYRATFKLYSLLPEESGLTGITSFVDLVEMTGLVMTLDCEESVSADDISLYRLDAVLTIDVSGVEAAMMAQAGGEEPIEEAPAEEAPAEEEAVEEEAVEEEAAGEEVADGEVAVEEAPEPLVMNLQYTEIDEVVESTASMTYDLDESRSLEVSSRSTMADGVTDSEMEMILTEDGARTMGWRLSMFLAPDGEGGSSYSLSARAIAQDQFRLDANLYGMSDAEGIGENSVSFELRTREISCGLSFDVSVTGDAIEDLANGRTPTVVIDDLSDEGMASLMENGDLLAALAKVSGSLGADVAKLAGDPGVKRVLSLLRGEGLPIDVDDLSDEAEFEYTIDMEGDEAGDEYAYVIGGEDGEEFGFGDDEVEDDGVLPFNEPQLTWLPDGWTVSDTAKDTAYDWVEMVIVDENGEECAYAIFYADPEVNAANYIVGEDGKVVEGRMINVTDFGEGGLSVTMADSGMYGNFMFASEAIGLEDIGQMVAGVQF